MAKIEAYNSKLYEAEGSFRAVALSPQLLDKRVIYLNRLSIFRTLAVPASTPLQMPLPDTMQMQQSNVLEENEERAEAAVKESKSKLIFSYPLAGVMGISMVMLGILAIYDKIPPAILIYAFIIVVGVFLSSYIADFIRDWFWHKPDEESLSPQDKVKDAFAQMLNEYKRAWELVKVQSQNSEKLPSYQRLDVDEVVYDREKQFVAKLPFRILELSGYVMNVCTENLQIRRDRVINALRDQRVTMKP
jgi:hypothetical protein